MDKTAIKNFAVWAREKLIKDIKYKAGTIGITENGIAEKLPQSTNDLHFYDIGTKEYAEVSGIKIKQRAALVKEIQTREHSFKNFQEAFDNVVEEVAYTWFNRLIAIRFMEVNDYLPSGVRVLSSENKAKKEPDMVTIPFDTDLEFTSEEQDIIIKLKDDNKLDELFRMLFIKQCNKLYDILPELFEKTDDYSELLLTISFTDPDGIIYHLVNAIEDADFRINDKMYTDDGKIKADGQVEIIGWLYQYYNIEPKAAVFARPKGEKISKEKIPAATQLFTPDWIVRYMVENSLGRIWIEGHPDNSLKDTWRYYIDEAEQEPDVVAKLEEIKSTYKELTPENIKIIDPCMGSGHILVYAFDVLMQIYERYGYTQRDAARSILKNNIFGLDIDKRAYQLAYFSIMMKARYYNRRILTENIKPNLCYLKNSIIIENSKLNRLGEAREIAVALIADNRLAEEYGSTLKISVSYSDVLILENKLAEISVNEKFDNLIDIADKELLVSSLTPIIQQSKLLSQKYEVVITNPPYMGGNYSKELSKYLKKNYVDTKADLFSVFMEKCMHLTSDYVSMITPESWMFLYTYLELRNSYLTNMYCVNCAHLGMKAFECGFGTTAFIFKKNKIEQYKSKFVRLTSFLAEEKKHNLTKDENTYLCSSEQFKLLPNEIMAYWCSFAFAKKLSEAKPFGEYYELNPGIKTGNNDLFLRFWQEVNYKKICCSPTKTDLSLRQYKWYFYNKGGGFRKWYGGYEYVVNFENNAQCIKKLVSKTTYRLRNPDNYFVNGILWPLIGSDKFSCRYLPSNVLSDIASNTIYFHGDYHYEALAFMNCSVFNIILNMINPTVSYPIDSIYKVPYYPNDNYLLKILVTKNINLAANDWDSFETSWDFKKHPLVSYSTNKTSTAFELWSKECTEHFNQLKANEEELNRIFIDIYGLQDELTPEVEDKDVTVRKANLQTDIKSLISYAVGCMFGRYSLDKEGLVFAGGNFDDVYWKYKGHAALDKNGEPIKGGYAGISLAEYHYPKFRDTDDWHTATELSFEPDADNCIPITDDEYFKDDIVGLFCAWLKKVYGEDTLEENLDFIANALGNKGKTSREVIRNYFLKDFFKDHVKTYQKRPIYWLFDSGKQNGFKALIYMHRWNADTIGNVRVEYLHRIQRVYEKEIARMQEIIDNSDDNKEISNATKRKEKLQKQIKETKDYDAKIAHLALSRIDIDLDDGVKVNYEKVQTTDGNKMQILVKI